MARRCKQQFSAHPANFMTVLEVPVAPAVLQIEIPVEAEQLV